MNDRLASGGESASDPDGFACMCNSACATIWTGGFVRDGNAVGIHMFQFKPDDAARWSPDELQRRTAKEIRLLDDFLARMGMPASLQARDWATPTSAMYYLTRQQAEAMIEHSAFAPILRAHCANPADNWPRCSARSRLTIRPVPFATATRCL